MMRKLIVIYKAFDVVKVPFPFTDSSQSKKRPALVLSSEVSFNKESGHSVMAMITSAKNRPWPLDVEIQNLNEAGLSAESVVRMKLFTLDHRFVISRLGSLSPQDRKSVSKSILEVLDQVI